MGSKILMIAMALHICTCMCDFMSSVITNLTFVLYVHMYGHTYICTYVRTYVSVFIYYVQLALYVHVDTYFCVCWNTCIGKHRTCMVWYSIQYNSVLTYVRTYSYTYVHTHITTVWVLHTFWAVSHTYMHILISTIHIYPYVCTYYTTLYVCAFPLCELQVERLRSLV